MNPIPESARCFVLSCMCVFVVGRRSPSVADLDGDGKLEVVVGTSVGFLYALNGHDGSNREGFPLQMGELQAQVNLYNLSVSPNHS